MHHNSRVVGMSDTERAGDNPTRLPPFLGFDAKSVVYSFAESLLATEIAQMLFGGHMTQQELDLFQFAACCMTESSA